jgi:predicted house-cleaning noncanonical NTP pyrophosphatase (MazG superfamily)
VVKIKKIYYNKLVRDKIPEVIKKSGGVAEFKKLSGKQFETELLKKVGEESTGLLSTKSKKELISEMADVVAVIDEIKKFKKIKDSELKTAMEANMEKKGGFKKKLFLVWSEDTGYRTNERTYSKKK